MKRELKRHIKQDEFRSGLVSASAWGRAHGRELRVTLVAVAVLVAAALAVQTFRGRQERAAESGLASATQTFHAPVTAELPPGAERPSGTVFATREEKLRKALGEFEDVAKRASGGLQRRAQYYAALCRMELGDAGAEKQLADLAARKDSDALVSSLARLALADLHRRNGRLEKAADAYRQMADDTSFALPRDHALMKLAAVLEEARRLPEAAASYRRVTEEFPASVYAAEARQRVEYLQSAAAQG
jgi:TolA-binding protein